MSNNIGLPIKSGFVIRNDAYEKPVTFGNRTSKLEVGDEKQAGKFEPQIKLSSMSNLFNFSARYKTEGKKGPKKVKKKNKKGKEVLSYELSDESVDFFDTDRGYEINIVLDESPDSNIFEFSLNTKDVIFYYQKDIDLMTAEEKEGLIDPFQPEDIKGSYAVYASYKPEDMKSKKEFTTGKIAHIYRPWAEDDSGSRVWCELNITGDTMTVTVPQTFLDAAVYPVIVDPEFGITDIGGTETTVPAKAVIDRSTGRQYTASADEQIDTYHFYAKATVDPVTVEVGSYDMGLTNDEDGSTLNSSADIVITSDSLVWNVSSDVDVALISGNNYAVALGNLRKGASGIARTTLDTTGGSTDGMAESTNAGALAATYDNDDGVLSYHFSMFATVGAQPGPPEFSGTIPDASFARTSSVSIATASYFTNPETFALNNAPAFLSINTTTGVITNTGTNVNGVYSGITVTCTNSLGNDTSNAFQVTITAQAPTLDTAITNKTGNVSNPITSVDTSLNFSFATSYAATGLPAGLTIDSGTGVISGTPTTQDGYTGVFVTATNVDGSTNSNTFTWTIGAALPIPTIASVNAGNGLQRSQTITVTGTNFEALQGTGGFTFNGIALSVDSWSDTSVDLIIPDGGFAYGVPYDLVMTNDSGYDVTVSDTFLPVPDYNYATLSANYAQLPSNSLFFEDASYSGLVVGDQPDFQIAASPEGTVTMDSLGVVTIEGATASGNYTFQHGILDRSDLTYSSNGTALVTLETTGADLFAPNWVSSPAVAGANITQTTATATATIDETGTIAVVVVLASDLNPTPAQVLLGLNADGDPALVAATATGTSLSEVLSGLAAGVAHKAIFTAQDDEATPNVRAGVSVVNFTTLAEVDTQPPIFTLGPNVNQVTENSCTLQATTNEASTIYWIITEQGNPDPGSAGIITGNIFDEFGEAISPLASGNGSILDNLIVLNLPSGTALKASFTARDANNNAQVNSTSVNFTTASAGTVRSISDQLVNRASGEALASTLLDYYILSDFGATVTDTGQLTTDASGNYSLTNLNVSAGTCWITFKDAATGTKVATGTVTVTEA